MSVLRAGNLPDIVEAHTGHTARVAAPGPAPLRYPAESRRHAPGVRRPGGKTAARAAGAKDSPARKLPILCGTLFVFPVVYFPVHLERPGPPVAPGSACRTGGLGRDEKPTGK